MDFPKLLEDLNQSCMAYFDALAQAKNAPLEAAQSAPTPPPALVLLWEIAKFGPYHSGGIADQPYVLYQQLIAAHNAENEVALIEKLNQAAHENTKSRAGNDLLQALA